MDHLHNCYQGEHRVPRPSFSSYFLGWRGGGGGRRGGGVCVVVFVLSTSQGTMYIYVPSVYSIKIAPDSDLSKRNVGYVYHFGVVCI